MSLRNFLIDIAVIVAVILLLLFAIGIVVQEAIRWCYRDDQRLWPRGNEVVTYQKARDIPDIKIDVTPRVTPSPSEQNIPEAGVGG